MDSTKNQTYQYSYTYKLKNYYKTWKQKHSGKNVLWRNIRVAINFVGILLVALKQPSYVDTWDAKKLHDSEVVISKGKRKMYICIAILQLFGFLRYNLTFNLDLFEKKIYGFHAVVLVKTFLFIYHSLLQVRYWRIEGDFFCQSTGRQTRFRNPHMETCRHTKNFSSKFNNRS